MCHLNTFCRWHALTLTLVPVPVSVSTNAPPSAQSNLLDLLKFGSTTGPPPSNINQRSLKQTESDVGSTDTHSVHGRGISASDLVASLRDGGSSGSTLQAAKPPLSSPASHQDSLLRLLNPSSSGVEGPENQTSRHLATTSLNSQGRVFETSGRNSSPIRFFGSKENTPTLFQPEGIAKASPSHNKSIFTYINPFEQLAASSPRNAQQQIASNGDSIKRKVKSPSPTPLHTSSRRKLTPSGSDILQSIESPGPEALKDGRTQVEALMGIGAPSKDAETVAEALNEVGDQVHKQVKHALAKAEGKEPEIKQEGQASTEIPSHVKAADSETKSFVQALKEKNADEWESADGEDTARKEIQARKVPVYQFPMRPFVSIDVTKQESDLGIREDSIVNIARFKKDFDQTDRTLATATRDFIVYGMPKNGGIRLIHQDNGTSSLLFPNTKDRVFNVVVSTAYPGTMKCGFQRIIATGVSGAVYCATIGDADAEFTQSEMDTQAITFPPTLSGSDATLSGQLKTRAKKSSRHPGFFAIGRGKSIHIVFPSHARNSDCFGDTSILDTEKYFADRSLKVTTGKAGKDFTFSEDDSTIVTLDKAGKLRLWDVRDLIADDNAAVSKLAPIEVKIPLLTFAIAHSTEKSWPTSVLFVDKIRAYTKGIAQRYIIVGMKQNHILQLWDLCLGKAVQELSFPHEKETDAICSVAYHPSSGIIAVGHPTRNSIYIIHLSAPRYNLQSMSQAKFIQRLASKDATLPKAEATAIMSGLREYSLAAVGQLRSLDLLSPSADTTKGAEDEDDRQLFELYVMHSKGVTCVGFKKEDLGWSQDSKAIHPVDAEKEGYIVVKDLREPSLPSISDPASINGDVTPSTSSKTSAKATSKTVEKSDRATSSAYVDKKKPKQKAAAEVVTRPTPAPTVMPKTNVAQSTFSPASEFVPNVLEESNLPGAAMTASRDIADASSALPSEGSSHPTANGEPISVGISGEFFNKQLKKIEHGVSVELKKTFQHELEALHRRLDNDKQVQNAATGANQEAILRLVSKQLGENVEKSLSTIVMNSIKTFVAPCVSEATVTALDKNLPHVLGQQVQHLLPVSLQSSLPDAISRSLNAPDMHRTVSDQVTKSVTGQVEREFASALQSTIIPSFKNFTTSTVQKISQDTEHRIREQLEQAELQRSEDSAKIDQLANSVRVLSQNIQQMAEAQSEFQSEILRLQQKSLQNQAVVRRDSPTPSESASAHPTPEQQEIETTSVAMQEGRYEDATIMVRLPGRGFWNSH